MSTHCTSCGNPVPAGQFRCGRCGAPQDDEETDAELPSAEGSTDSDEGLAAKGAPEGEPIHEDGLNEDEIALNQSAVSLPPPPAEDEALEVDHGEADPAEGSRKQEPVETFKEEDTDKRKLVPKGAFGEGSVVDKLPAAPETGDEDASESKPEKAATRESTGKVARLPGLEPTRHKGEDDEDEDSEEGEGEEAADGDGEPAGEGDGSDESNDAPLELDVPSGGIRQLPHKPRPPFLASELMRGEIIPQRPGAHSIARLSQACGVMAVVAYMLLVLVRPDALAWGAPAMLLLGLGVVKLPYVPRATGLAALALGTLFTCYGAAQVPGTVAHLRYLPFVVLWLSASLLLRFWYRGHRQPPWLVAIGVLLATALGLVVADQAGPWELTGHWQSWLPAVAAFVYVQLCLLSLFAFMGPETNAAGATWALAWWGWNAAAYLILMLAHATPEGSPLTVEAAVNALTDGGLISIFVVPPGAFALAQLYAVGLSRYEPEAADDPHITPA